MKKHHYVYHSYEEWGKEYIGIRSCDCLPEEDTKYFGSFKDKTFSPKEKTILFVCETRKEASEIEIKLHDFFDVAVNTQFANQAKQTSTKFDTTGVPQTEAQKKAHSERMSGKTHTEETKKKMSEARSGKYAGENCYLFGRTGALHHRSKPITIIKPDGTELHFGSGREAAKAIKVSSIQYYINTGKSPKKGEFKDCKFIYKNSTNF